MSERLLGAHLVPPVTGPSLSFLTHISLMQQQSSQLTQGHPSLPRSPVPDLHSPYHQAVSLGSLLDFPCSNFDSSPGHCEKGIQTALLPLQKSFLRARTVLVSLSLFFLKLDPDNLFFCVCHAFLDLWLFSRLSTSPCPANLSLPPCLLFPFLPFASCWF